MKPPVNDLPTTTILAFWKHMMTRHRDEWLHGKPKPEGVRHHVVEDAKLVVSLTTGIDFVRIFVRGLEGAKAADVRKRLEGYEAALRPLLGAPLPAPGEKDRFFSDRLGIDMPDQSNWDRAADWLHDRAAAYETALLDVMAKT